MNKKLLFLFLAVFLCVITHGQTKKITQKAVQLFEQRNIHLNGGNMAVLGSGKKSRVCIPIDLPPNTIEWYYSFSTSNNKQSIDNLNLLIQLGGLLIANVTPLGTTLSSSGITETILSQIKIPYGSHAIDVYLFDKANMDKFEKRKDIWGDSFQFIPSGSTENTTQGLIRVKDVTSGSWFIGLRNPSLTYAVDVVIEGIAIVAKEEIVQPTDEQRKAELYANMGKKAFEKGDYEKCLGYSKKAIQLDSSLVQVKLNISLCYLVQEKPDYLDSYIDAISSCKKSEHPKEFLQAGLKNIKAIKKKLGEIKNSDEIIELINEELKKL